MPPGLATDYFIPLQLLASGLWERTSLDSKDIQGLSLFSPPVEVTLKKEELGWPRARFSGIPWCEVGIRLWGGDQASPSSHSCLLGASVSVAMPFCSLLSWALLMLFCRTNHSSVPPYLGVRDWLCFPAGCSQANRKRWQEKWLRSSFTLLMHEIGLISLQASLTTTDPSNMVSPLFFCIPSLCLNPSARMPLVLRLLSPSLSLWWILQRTKPSDWKEEFPILFEQNLLLNYSKHLAACRSPLKLFMQSRIFFNGGRSWETQRVSSPRGWRGVSKEPGKCIRYL